MKTHQLILSELIFKNGSGSILFHTVISLAGILLISACATASKERDPTPPVQDGYREQRTLTILQNDGAELRIKIGRMHTEQDKYRLCVKFNDQAIEKRQVSLGEELSFPIEERGKYTFDFRRLRGGLARPYLLWQQNVFVQPRDLIPLSDQQIKALAAKYSPILSQHPDERYFPASLEYITNDEDKDNDLDEEEFVLWSGKERFALYDILIPGNLAEQRSRLIRFPYRDLRHVIPFNGDANAVLKAGTDGFLTGTSKHETLLAKRFGNPRNITVYYSYFVNRQRRELFLHYHFLYTYDPKLGDEKNPAVAAHIMDRESLSLIFDLNTLEPSFVVYGAHISSQRMSILNELGNELQRWDGGRVFVRWQDIRKFGNHPLGSIAKGSHALYPVVGTYRIYVKNLRDLVEQSGGGAFLVHDEVTEFPTELPIHRYYLKDLKIWNSNSTSKNYLLSYGGALADGVLFANSAFPPYTDRELDVDNYLDWRTSDAYIGDKSNIPKSAYWHRYFNTESRDP